jgi:hypothetical protein
VRCIVKAKRFVANSAALVLALTSLTPTAAATELPKNGQVEIPLEQYQQMLESIRDPNLHPSPAPFHYAYGEALVELAFVENDKRLGGTVAAVFSVNILDDNWVSVPLLPAGTSVVSAQANGQPIELAATEQGLSWGVKKAGRYDLKLQYRVEVAEGSTSVSIPWIKAPGAKLKATVPVTGITPSIIPATAVTTTENGDSTTIEGQVPAAASIELAWHQGDEAPYTISRAEYKGDLGEKAINWTGQLTVELFHDQNLTLDLFPTSVTLTDVTVDDKPSSVLVSANNSFATKLKGKGVHKISVSFSTPLPDDAAAESALPTVSLDIPRVPVSKFILNLPGKKEVTINADTEAEAQFTKTDGKDRTTATANIPMSDQVTFSWKEAVPEEGETEFRANTGLYHAVWAEEGVLYVHALLSYEITRGETNKFEIAVPAGVQINKITPENVGLTDWRLVKGENGKSDTVTVFLDRKVKGEVKVAVDYDRSITGDLAGKDIDVPLLKASGVARQRGMIALLSGKDLAFKPIREDLLTRVGENQLPPFIKDGIDKTISHTFKYVEEAPQLVVQTTAPERKEGRFDAGIETLISLGEVALRGSSTVALNIKSGTISSLKIGLPKDVNVLGVTAPSLRTHTVLPTDSGQTVDVQFTQEMEGQIKVEVLYERILPESEREVAVPTLSIAGADVERGRIAVEALSAAEVQPAQMEHLSVVDIAELSQQLVLKTTNPILLAFKYAHTEPYKLSLNVTRHQETGVQEATIDSANYQTLYTEDGVAVTTAKFMVRNTRKQFLRIELPPHSTVWSALVDGKPEKPALAEESGAHKNADDAARPSGVLIKIINSTEPFPVALVYQTDLPALGAIGKVSGALPRPDIIATRSRWEVFLPSILSYGRVESNMKTIEEGTISSAELADRFKTEASRQGTEVHPLMVDVPTEGRRFVFEKLYANQAKDEAEFTITYFSRFGGGTAQLLGMIGVFALFFVLSGLVEGRSRSLRGIALQAGGGAALIALIIGYFGLSYMPTLIVGVLLLLSIAARRLPQRDAINGEEVAK